LEDFESLKMHLHQHKPFPKLAHKKEEVRRCYKQKDMQNNNNKNKEFNGETPLLSFPQMNFKRKEKKIIMGSNEN
jgi:hypothetical protein